MEALNLSKDKKKNSKTPYSSFSFDYSSMARGKSPKREGGFVTAQTLGHKVKQSNWLLKTCFMSNSAPPPPYPLFLPLYFNLTLYGRDVQRGVNAVPKRGLVMLERR